MDKFFKSIDNQIKFNQGKNIFLDDKDFAFGFIDETIKALSGINDISPDSEKLLIDYATSKTLEEFCRINQYYTFNTKAKEDLRIIYSDLFSAIRKNEEPAEAVSRNHFQNLKQWLRITNPFAEKLYNNESGIDISPVACSEYRAESQINVLKIETGKLKEPFLDIGCGKKGYLVKYLYERGVEVVGIDRFSFSDDYLIDTDWLEYDYGIQKWGTIVSNLGFSNHFKHHNLRNDGNYIEYARKYMEILRSLKPGGSFHYAPDLPFIEIYLDSNHFKVDKFEIDGYDFRTTVITRLE